MFFGLTNPIPDEVKDKDNLITWITKHNAIPYYGSGERSSHRFLTMIRDLCELSPTHRATMKQIKTFAFGSRLNVVARAAAGLSGEEVEIDYNRQVEFKNYLLGLGVNIAHIPKMSKRGEEMQTQSGQAWLLIKRARVGGAVRYSFEMLHYLHVIYTKSKDPGERFVLVSKFLPDHPALAENEPAVYRVTPEGEPLRFMTTEDKQVEATVVHLFAGENEGDGEYYERSSRIDTLTYYFADYQSGNHLSKVSGTEIVSKKLILMEREGQDFGGDGPDSFERSAQALKKVTTAMEDKPGQMGPKKGQAAVALLEYPNGTKPPTSLDLEVNRDSKYLDLQIQNAGAFVAASLGWALELIGTRPAKATLGGNLLYDTFVLKNESTIKPKQEYWAGVWNDIISQICEAENAPSEFKDYGIAFPDVISKMLESLKGTTAAPAQMINNQDEPDQAADLDNTEEDE